MEKKMINIVVMENNKAYNDLLSHALQHHLLMKKKFLRNLDLKMYSFTDPELCAETVHSEKFTGISIAFLDYYPGKGTNGLHLLKIFKEKNNKIKFVVLSQSDRVVNKLMNSRQIDLYGQVIRKDIYTPEVCCILLDDFLEKYLP
jgi:hypothetical protein